ncbi:MAG: glutathione S-transferase family protein, partial [Nevskiales bacterium]
GIPHYRRSLLPGFHMREARRLTGQTMLPILVMNGRAINDSTRIIEALEQAYPAVPLYPEDTALRRRALELEEYFDEEWGPHLRSAAFYLMRPYPRYFASLADTDRGLVTRLVYRTAFPLMLTLLLRKRKTKLDKGAFDESHRKVEEGLARLEREIQPSGYLVGDRFTVADLTAAAMLSPMMRPPQFPYPATEPRPQPVAEYRQRFAARPGWRWAEEMYRRHRGRWVQVPAGAVDDRRVEGLRLRAP